MSVPANISQLSNSPTRVERVTTSLYQIRGLLVGIALLVGGATALLSALYSLVTIDYNNTMR